MKIPSVKGFHDVLPGESARWAAIDECARRVFGTYDFHEIRLPVMERTELFARSLGAASDIVEKEMYTFEDRDGKSVTLRPEGTASVVRAYVEHAMAAQEPVSRLYYIGPMFRRERPQKGRLRQFSQIGAEFLGRDDAVADAEVLLLLHDLLESFGTRDAEVRVNTLGCRECRPGYRVELIAWGGGVRERLCDDCKRRLQENPLRVLDCKREPCAALRDTAPRMLDHACAECAAHFARVIELLATEGVRPQTAPYMVRGLDYYCRTAFEVIAPGLGAQNALGGGGRYDGLVRDLGGPPVAGIGFALGVERLLLVLGEEGPRPVEAVEFAVLAMGAEAEAAALGVAHRLRRQGARTTAGDATRSLKSQMRHAGRLGARYALILGEDELAAGALTVRDLRERCDYRMAVPLTASVTEVRLALEQLGKNA